MFVSVSSLCDLQLLLLLSAAMVLTMWNIHVCAFPDNECQPSVMLPRKAGDLKYIFILPNSIAVRQDWAILHLLYSHRGIPYSSNVVAVLYADRNRVYRTRNGYYFQEFAKRLSYYFEWNALLKPFASLGRDLLDTEYLISCDYLVFCFLKCLHCSLWWRKKKMSLEYRYSYKQYVAFLKGSLDGSY